MLRHRWIRIGLFGILLALVAYGVFHSYRLATLGAAYAAKVMCSAVFVSHREPETLRGEELSGALRWVRFKVEQSHTSVTAWFPGVRAEQAIARPGFGCTLVIPADSKAMFQRTAAPTATSGLDPADRESESSNRWIGVAKSSLLPIAALPERVEVAIEETLDRAFAETDPDRPLRTRALVAVHNGQIVAERYAPGISPETPLAGWSMTKSVTNALVGILVRQGRLRVQEPAPVALWQGPDDPRGAITLDHLLRMTSGLAFDERTGAVLSDVNRMLLLVPDAAGYAASKRLSSRPGSQWKYSSGTTNILSGIIRHVCCNASDYTDFPRRQLFDPLGMTSAVLERDPTGTFVGSSLMYATARDWARFGLLYINDGVWNGIRILPEGWVSYSMKPTDGAPDGRYGAHWWLDWEEPLTKGETPQGHPDVYYAHGYEGQYLIAMPKRKLVVVRLGQTPDQSIINMRAMVKALLNAFEQPVD